MYIIHINACFKGTCVHTVHLYLRHFDEEVKTGKRVEKKS